MTAAASVISISRSKKTRTADRRRAKLDIRPPRLARDLAIEVRTASVPDPYEPGSYITTTVNRRVDILAHERANGRISEAELLVGRQLQTAWERSSGNRIGSANWAGSGSRATMLHGLSAAEANAIALIVDAKQAGQVMERAAATIGHAGVRFLRSIICETGTFADYAKARGWHGERAVRDVAQRFRWTLRDLVEAQHTAHGPEHGRIRAARIADDA